MAETLDFAALWPFDLGRGGLGEEPDENDKFMGYTPSKSTGPCFLEVASFLRTGQCDDYMKLADEVLGDFIMVVQDEMPDDERQRLKQFIPRFVGSYDQAWEAERLRYLVNDAIEKWLVLALEAAGFDWDKPQPREYTKLEGFLLDIKCQCDGLPIVEEIVEWAWSLCEKWREEDGEGVLVALGGLATEIMKLNYEPARRLMLPDGLILGGEPVNIARVPGIYDALINSIDGALKLGRQGPELDPWVVAEAVERFKQAIPRGFDGAPCEFPAFAIVE